MAYDVARAWRLHPALGDGWIRFDAPAGMVIPESVASTVSTAFRNSSASRTGPHPAARRSTAQCSRPPAGSPPTSSTVTPEGVVLGPDRAALLASLAEAAATRTGLGSEVVVSRLDDEANIVPWLRAADRYGAKLRWAEIDIETGELPTWQWDELLQPRHPAGRAVLGLGDSRHRHRRRRRGQTRAQHRRCIDHTAAAPYRLLDIGAVDADVVALNATAWGGPPIGALVFRDPGLIGTLTPISTDPHASGAARLELGGHQYGLLAGLVASVEAPSSRWTRQPREAGVKSSRSQWNRRPPISTDCSTTWSVRCARCR